MSIKYSDFKNAFAVEKMRDSLAFYDEDNAFKKLYSSRLPEIKNLNTTNFWDSRLDFDNDQYLSGIAKERLNMLHKMTYHKEGNYLGVGFGSGLLESKLSSSKLKIFGIDMSRLSVKKAQINLKGTFKQAEAAKIPFKNNFFDVAVASEVLEHIPPSKAFKSIFEVKKKLKNNAIFIITIPINEGLEFMLKNKKNPNGHVRIYTKNIIHKELSLSGFTIKKTYELYAFKSYYNIKNLIRKYVFPKRWKPNNLIIIAQKK